MKLHVDPMTALLADGEYRGISVLGGDGRKSGKTICSQARRGDSLSRTSAVQRPYGDGRAKQGNLASSKALKL